MNSTANSPQQNTKRTVHQRKAGEGKVKLFAEEKKEAGKSAVLVHFLLPCHGTLILSSFLKIKFRLLKHFSPSENFTPNLKTQTKLDWIAQNGEVIKLQ